MQRKQCSHFAPHAELIKFTIYHFESIVYSNIHRHYHGIHTERECAAQVLIRVAAQLALGGGGGGGSNGDSGDGGDGADCFHQQQYAFNE